MTDQARRYVILQDKAAGRKGAFGSIGTARSRDPRVEPQVNIADLTSNDIKDLREKRDVTVKGFAPLVRISLIRPTKIEWMADGQLPACAWGINAVMADLSPYDGRGVVVAVLDTGIDKSHAAFANMDITQEDFTGEGKGDQNGHGTHCAGTIFGRDVAGTRIGIARGVQTALDAKVLGKCGTGDSDTVSRGLLWAADQGANIVAMSLAFDFPGTVEQMVNEGWPVALATSRTLIDYRANLRFFDTLATLVRTKTTMTANGCIMVGAAGNESRTDDNPDYKIGVSLPSAADDVISVGALGKEGEQMVVANFSNTLPDISAPGVGIISARRGGGLELMDGTSMACPHVAGVAALWWQALHDPKTLGRTAKAVGANLLSEARDSVFASRIDRADFGAGLVTAPQKNLKSR